MGRRERAIDPDEGTTQRFAYELRLLRESAGRPSYRDLARRAHYSVTALSEAAGGEAFPSLPVTLAYVRACGGDPDEWRQRWETTSRQLLPEVDDADTSKSPYLGLASFQPEHASDFFGRRGLIEQSCARIGQSPFLAVFGTSGSGKSSLLRAGVLPALWRGALSGSEDWPTVLLTPGSRPIEALAIALANLQGISAVPAVTHLASEPGSVCVLIRQVLSQRTANARLVIVVDQFEEIFTLCRDVGERAGFIDCLLAAAGGCEGRARIVVGVRADFYARCASYPALVTALCDHQVLVGPIDADDLRSVIREPAVRAGLTVETSLVEAVLTDAVGEPGALPLISHVLLETWKRRSGDRMTLAGYRSAGGVQGAIARTAERVFGEFDGREQGVVRDVFLRLTALGEGTEDTRRRVARGELLGGPDAESVTKVLSRLAEERLVTLGQDTVEVAHEALIRAWPRLRAWLTEDRELLAAHRRLTDTVAEWTRHDRDDGLLYRGARLTAWQDRPPDRLNDAERGFLALSRRAADRERTARRRRVRLAFGGLAAVAVVVAVLALVAMRQAGEADAGRQLAYSRQLIADARAQALLDPELGLLLARQAYQARPSEETEAALRQASVESHVRASVSGHEGKITGVAFSRDGAHLVTSGADGALRVWRRQDGRLSGSDPIVLRGHRGEVWSPVFSPDGTRIAAAGVDGVVRVWDWAARTAVTLQGHEGAVWSVAFSPDGQRVATAGQDGTLRVWPAGGGEPTVWRGHVGRVLGVSFAPDGRRVASSGGDGTVRIWDLAGGGDPIVLRGHDDTVEAIAFSPDGRQVATASTDGTARVWDASGATGSRVLGSHDGTAEGITYSADGRWIASTGNDGTVRVWNADRRAAALVLRGHRGTVWAAAFSPDGKSVASASDDGTARVWDLDEADDLVVLRGHAGPVWSVAPGPDGRRVAGAGEDGTVRLWDLSARVDPVVLRGAGGPMTQVVFSPDGRRIAGVGGDGTVRIWPSDGAAEPVVLPGEPQSAWRVAFSPDGQRVAVADSRDSVRLWNVSGTGEPTVLGGDQGKLVQVAWSPDGHRVAAAGLDGTVVVWDVAERGAPVVLRGHQGQVWTLAFSPDGLRLASGGNDGSVRIWPMTGTGEPVVLHGHQGVVWGAAFTADGRYLATSGNDATTRLWTLGRAGESLVLRGFRASVESVAVTADGRFVTAHDDGTVRLWRCRVCGPVADVLADAGQHVTRELTAEERATYLHGS